MWSIHTLFDSGPSHLIIIASISFDFRFFLHCALTIQPGEIQLTIKMLFSIAEVTHNEILVLKIVLDFNLVYSMQFGSFQIKVQYI